MYKENNWLYKKYPIQSKNNDLFYRTPKEIIDFFQGKSQIISRIPSKRINLNEFELQNMNDIDIHTDSSKYQQLNLINDIEQDVNFDISKNFIKTASSFGLNEEEIKQYLEKGSNGEYLIARILGDKTGKSVTGRNALWDITLNGKKFEVKDATKGSFWTGKTGRSNAKNFIKEISIALEQFDKFKQRIYGSQLNELSEIKRTLNEINYSILDNLKYGEFKAQAINDVKNFFQIIKNLKSTYSLLDENLNNENLFIKFSTLNDPISIPKDKRNLYYLIVNYIERNLALDSNLMLNDPEKIDYIRSIFSILNNPLFDNPQLLDHLFLDLKNPDKNFNNEIDGLFIITKADSNNPNIHYFLRSNKQLLEQSLEFERISKSTSKFKLKGIKT